MISFQTSNVVFEKTLVHNSVIAVRKNLLQNRCSWKFRKFHRKSLPLSLFSDSWACNFIKKRVQEVFSCEIYEIHKNNFLTNHLKRVLLIITTPFCNDTNLAPLNTTKRFLLAWVQISHIFFSKLSCKLYSYLQVYFNLWLR